MRNRGEGQSKTTDRRDREAMTVVTLPLWLLLQAAQCRMPPGGRAGRPDSRAECPRASADERTNAVVTCHLPVRLCSVSVSARRRRPPVPPPERRSDVASRDARRPPPGREVGRGARGGRDRRTRPRRRACRTRDAVAIRQRDKVATGGSRGRGRDVVGGPRAALAAMDRQRLRSGRVRGDGGRLRQAGSRVWPAGFAKGVAQGRSAWRQARGPA